MSKIDEYQARYMAAMHAMQAGVSIDESRGSRDLSPKHLRVGVNSALVDCASLAKALIDKGVLSEEEYFRALAEGAEREKAEYEERLSSGGIKVTLV